MLKWGYIMVKLRKGKSMVEIVSSLDNVQFGLK